MAAARACGQRRHRWHCDLDCPLDAHGGLARRGCACPGHATTCGNFLLRRRALLARRGSGGSARVVPERPRSPGVPARSRGQDSDCRHRPGVAARAGEGGVCRGRTGEERPQGRFIPITCVTPIIMAHPMGFYTKHGLNVEVVKTAGWAVIRDKTLNQEYDAAQMLSPMPLAITLGAGSNPIPYTMPAVENINGQAITLSIKHRDKRDPKAWKGFKFAVPFDYSMHNYLLRYYVAEYGLDPDTEIQIRAVPPPEMVANLRADDIDGFLGPDPFNQR